MLEPFSVEYPGILIVDNVLPCPRSTGIIGV